MQTPVPVLFISLGVITTVSSFSIGQSVRTYSSTASSNAWTGSNWGAGTAFPGTTNGSGVNPNGHAGDTAVIGAFAFTPSNGLGIDFNHVNGSLPNSTNGILTLGAIDFISTTSNLRIGNSSPDVRGVLVLTGATINSISNTLVAVRGSRNLALDNSNSTVGVTTQLMRVELGNSSGVFQVSTGRTLSITTVLGQSSLGNGFTLDGGGTLSLNKVSEYSGVTTINSGVLNLLGEGSVANTSSISLVGADAVLSVAGTTSPFSLGGSAAQTLQGVGRVSGLVTVASQGTIRGGIATGTGVLTTRSVTIDNGGQLDVQFGPGTSASRIDLSTTDSVLQFNNGSVIDPNGPVGSGTRVIATLSTGTGRLVVNGNSIDTDADIGSYTFSTGSTGLQNLGTSGVKIDITDLSLTHGDKLTLSRSGNHLVLSITPVPEPASILWVCLLFSCGGVALRTLLRRAKPAALTPAA